MNLITLQPLPRPLPRLARPRARASYSRHGALSNQRRPDREARRVPEGDDRPRLVGCDACGFIRYDNAEDCDRGLGHRRGIGRILLCRRATEGFSTAAGRLLDDSCRLGFLELHAAWRSRAIRRYCREAARRKRSATRRRDRDRGRGRAARGLQPLRSPCASAWKPTGTIYLQLFYRAHQIRADARRPR